MVILHSYVKLPEGISTIASMTIVINYYPSWYHTVIYTYTSSTAQGGGGSFKNRKPIGEVGCCESGMAKRIQWWTERCLRSPLCLSPFLWLSTYLPAYLLCFYLSIDLSTYLPTYLSISLSLFHLSICLAAYLSVYLSICLSVYLWCRVIQCIVV